MGGPLMPNDIPGLPIRLANVHKRFGDRTVLDGITIDIPAGESVVIVGPSGGGKSTLLRCLNGLALIDAGEIHVGEHRLSSAERTKTASLQQVRRLFGMIFQDFQLFPHLNVLANVIEAPVRVRGMHRDEATARGGELLRRVGMSGDGAPRIAV